MKITFILASSMPLHGRLHLYFACQYAALQEKGILFPKMARTGARLSHLQNALYGICSFLSRRYPSTERSLAQVVHDMAEEVMETRADNLVLILPFDTARISNLLLALGQEKVFAQGELSAIGVLAPRASWGDEWVRNLCFMARKKKGVLGQGLPGAYSLIKTMSSAKECITGAAAFFPGISLVVSKDEYPADSMVFKPTALLDALGVAGNKMPEINLPPHFGTSLDQLNFMRMLSAVIPENELWSDFPFPWHSETDFWAPHPEFHACPLLSSEQIKELCDSDANSDREVAKQYFGRDELFPRAEDIPQYEWKPYPGLSAENTCLLAQRLSPGMGRVIRKLVSRFSLNLLSPENVRFYDRVLNALPPIGATIRKNKNGLELPTDFEPPRVSVLTFCCNQVDTIEKCILSVQQQKCSFPVEHIIVDSGSIDGSWRIIRRLSLRYPSIRAISTSGDSYVGDLLLLLSKAQRPYAAFCRASDAFTDTAKLQKQVTFLESNPLFSFCWHPAVPIEGSPSENVKRHASFWDNNSCRSSAIDDFRNIPPSTTLYRWIPLDISGEISNIAFPIEHTLHVVHARMGEVGFIAEVMTACATIPRRVVVDRCALLDNECAKVTPEI